MSFNLTRPRPCWNTSVPVHNDGRRISSWPQSGNKKELKTRQKVFRLSKLGTRYTQYTKQTQYKAFQAQWWQQRTVVPLYYSGSPSNYHCFTVFGGLLPFFKLSLNLLLNNWNLDTNECSKAKNPNTHKNWFLNGQSVLTLSH